jgi:hypothetical protein
MLSNETKLNEAIHWWEAERISSSNGKITATEGEKRNLHRIKIILPFVFQTLDSLYITTRKIPSPWSNSTGVPATIGGTNNIIINLDISPESLALLRAILSLVSDIYYMCKSLTNICNLLELKTPIEQLCESTDKFRDIRNFFTHLDERLCNLDTHGITGAIKTNCNIEYTTSAKGNLHLILAGDKIYFSDKGEPKEVDISKAAFDYIFINARYVYAELISHKVHAQIYNHAPPENLYI